MSKQLIVYTKKIRRVVVFSTYEARSRIDAYFPNYAGFWANACKLKIMRANGQKHLQLAVALSEPKQLRPKAPDLEQPIVVCCCASAARAFALPDHEADRHA